MRVCVMRPDPHTPEEVRAVALSLSLSLSERTNTRRWRCVGPDCMPNPSFCISTQFVSDDDDDDDDVSVDFYSSIFVEEEGQVEVWSKRSHSRTFLSASSFLTFFKGVDREHKLRSKKFHTGNTGSCLSFFLNTMASQRMTRDGSSHIHSAHTRGRFELTDLCSF
ncbi:Hypothetical predicted protein [Xyrichtys novacula]|uniref:Uncharacterized protein n=1 Tax=Xyrichtys novacula TaxID=13765 RepID=A0AAV1GUE9_XYRNO|nr:Hypothetical predicted protein [Xyrichtys novacula]